MTRVKKRFLLGQRFVQNWKSILIFFDCPALHVSDFVVIDPHLHIMVYETVIFFFGTGLRTRSVMHPCQSWILAC